MSNNRKPRKYIFRKILATLLSAIVIAAIIGGTFVLNKMKAMINERPVLELSKLKTPEPTYVYDANGELFAELGIDTSENIVYDQLPNSVIDAFLAIEDSRYFGHNGFDIARFVKSIGTNVASLAKGGGYGQGASTITMQTIKNGFFVTKESLADVTVDRKVQEISLAMDLEEISNKETILEFYLNKINFNVPNSRGIAKAASYYFGKEVEELSVSEAAYLAGMINAPAVNNAYTNLKQATIRRNEVLDLMEYHGYITKEEKIINQNIKLENQLVGKDKYRSAKQPYQEYLDVVIEEAINEHGLDPYTNSLKIYTALNRDQQDLIQEIERGEHIKFEDSKINIAMVTLNNQNGELIAIGGGRDFGQNKVARGFNFASMNYRQPGSVLKPILPYSLAFEYLGYGTNHVIEDGPYVYKGTSIFVNNASRKFKGDVTLTKAIELSLNIPTLKTFDELASNQGIGRQAMIDYLKNMGLRNVDKLSSAYAIGAGYFEVTPIQVAGVHATMINNGEYIKPHTITKIEVDGDSPIIVEPVKTKVISPEGAYITSEFMREAVETDEITPLRNLRNKFPVYGKSGTSSYGKEFVKVGIPEGVAKDNWMAGSTSNYTNVVWRGYEKNVVDGKAYYIKDAYNFSVSTAKYANLLINNTTKFSNPKSLERPKGVSEIEHIVGVYPYVKPVNGMDDKLIVKSLIKKDFDDLGELSEVKLQNLGTQKVEVGSFLLIGLKVDVNMSAYPDASKLRVAPSRKTMSAKAVDGTVVKAEGDLAFDPSWIYGKVQYGTEIRSNGNVIEKKIDDYNTRSMMLINVQPNQYIQVCSFYTWEKNPSVRSNEICETVSTGEQNIRFPKLIGQNLDAAVDWLKQNSKGIEEVKMMKPTSKNQIGTVAAISPDFSDKEVSMADLKSTGFTLYVYDGEVTGLNRFIGKPLKQLINGNPYPNVLTITADTNDLNAEIESIKLANSKLRDFKLTEVSEIIVKTKEIVVEPVPVPEPTPTPEPTPVPEPTPTPEPGNGGNGNGKKTKTNP